MRFIETGIAGAVVIEPEYARDERGSFARTWCRHEFSMQGLADRFVQCSTSYNHRAGTVRGMHFQRAPHLEAKLVRCTRGRAFDVVVDLRRNSPTFGRWKGVELGADNGKMMYIPEGVAHGFQTLDDATEIFYQISTYYAPDYATGVRWDDPDIGIRWPLPGAPVISDRDRAQPLLRELFPETETRRIA